MSRRLIIVEDPGEEGVTNLEQGLELLRSQGLKAYPVSSVFATDLLRQASLAVAASEPASPQAEQAAIQTLLGQKTLLEDELRRFRTLIENSGDLMYAIDFGGNLTFVSHNVTSFLGYTAEEMIGQNFLKNIAPSARAAAYDRLMSQLAGTASGPFTTELLTKDGKVVPVEINGRNYYENKLPVLNIGLVRDITQRKAMEAEVLKRNRELTALYSVASVLSRSLDLNELLQESLDRTLEAIGVETGSMLLLNPNGEMRLGAARGVTGEFEILFSPLQNDFKLLRRVMSAGEVIIIEDLSTLKGLDPTKVAASHYNSLVIGPLRAKSRILGGFVLASKGDHHFVADDRELIRSIGNQVGMALEIGQLYAELNNKVAELGQTNNRLEEATRHKSEFLANMSHELRTPLNAIIGFSELLIDQTYGPLNPKQNRYVDNIFNSGKHLLALVNDVLDLAKVEAGKMELQFDELSVREIINDVLNIVAPLAAKKDIALASQLDGPGKGEIKVKADRSRFRQILYNLLSNAIKFTPDGGLVEVHSTVVRRQKADWLELSVVDNGIGIKPEDQSRIFEEFQMADSTLSKRQQGTGLGLALSRRLAEMHGGEIRLKSEVGQGSTFVVAMPLNFVPPEIEPTTPEQITPGSPPSSGPGEEVALIIEDEDQSAELLQLYMEEAGYRVVRCSNGATALQTAREVQPSVITLDIMLPSKNGWDVLQELKNDPATDNIPVMIVSMMDNYDSSFTLGATAWFVKPVRREDLLVKLNELQPATARQRRRQQFEQHRQSGEPLQALVIDDNPDDRELIASVLKQAGMKVETAENGETGWQLVHIHRPDLVVLDLMMPAMNGFQVLKRLRQHLSTLDIPVFIFTAKDLNPTERDQLETAEAVFQKGEFSSQRLLDAVSNLSRKNEE